VPKRLALTFATLLLLPTALKAQGAGAAPAMPATRSLAIPNPMACPAECRPAAVLAIPQATPALLVNQDVIDGSRSGVMYGAAIGGMLGGATIAVYTLWDNQQAPPTWWEALAAPVAGALVGAGIGLLF